MRHRPQPQDCLLTLQNADDWRQRADDALSSREGALNTAMLDKAALLHSDALRDRLAQGKDEPFIAGLLMAQDVGEVANYLTQALGRDTRQEPDPVQLLTRYLKRLSVRELCLIDFSPSKRTIERGDLDQLASEFRAFLLDALAADEDELPVIELE